MSLRYDKYSKSSIIEFAKRLEGTSLRDVCGNDILNHNYSGKGSLGQILEKFYFLYDPNSDAKADFDEVGLELKTSPIKKLKNSKYRSKERLVLNIINYLEVVHQNFETSSFWKKNAHLLLVFYLYESDKNILDYIIKLVDEWNFPALDLQIIKQDWQIIKNKILSGKAHELSEGDTFYLGACTKGSKGGNLRKQPYSTQLAKQRAYSLKQGYVNHIIASLTSEPSLYGKLIPSLEIVNNKTIEEIVISKFSFYYNKTIDEILEKLSLQINKKSKNFYANLTNAILGIGLNKEIEEFKKAEIIVKTIRLKENNLPKEDISFPVFKYEEIIDEDWEESKIKKIMEHKFLFVFFKFEDEKLILKKVKFWNMPYSDILEVEKVYNQTKAIIKTGNIIKYIKIDKNDKKIRHTNFPDKKFNRVAHVRPHALNAKDTIALPIEEKLTGEKKYTKHCFWLNNTYVRDNIYFSSSVD
ncbi:Sau3AI family type II restriction endonuclease [Sulfurimonas sp.]